MSRFAAGSKNNVLRKNTCLVPAFHTDQITVFIRSHKESATVKERDFVLSEEIKNSVISLTNDLGLAGNHRRNINRGFFNMNPVLGSFVSDFFKETAARKKSLRGNAPDIGASTSGCRFTVRDPIINAAYG